MSRTITHVSVASKSHKLKKYSQHNHGAFQYFLSDKWLAPSKLLADALEEKLLGNSLQQRQHVSVPLLQEVSRSLIAIVLALLHSAKSVATKKVQIFLSASCHSSA